jgi:hypothetical protein
VETQLLLAKELQYISEVQVAALLKETATIGSALTGLINSLAGALSSAQSQPAESRKPRPESLIEHV